MKLELNEEGWNIPEWTAEEKQKYHRSLLDLSREEGIVFGAFDVTKTAGIIALRREFIGRNKDQLTLAALWVSFPYRKHGVGTRLVEMVKNKARAMGAKKLYVSASPSKNTVDFYANAGFQLAKEVDRELFEREPEDMHMELDLQKRSIDHSTPRPFCLTEVLNIHIFDRVVSNLNS